MLAELYFLNRSLEASGHTADLTHRDFQSPPGLSTYETLIAKINEEGAIESLRCPLDEEEPGLWTLKKGNFKFFPAVRLAAPLFSIELADQRRDALFPKPSAKSVDANAWLETLVALEQSPELQLNPQNFIELAKAQGGRIARWPDEGSKHIPKLKKFVAAFHEFSKDPAVTAARLLAAIKDQCLVNPSKDLLIAFSHLLIGIRKEKKGKPPEHDFKLQIIFDFAAPSDMAFTLHQREVHQTVLTALAQESEESGVSETIESETNSRCAFQSASHRLLSQPFGGFSIRPVINKEQAPYSKKGGANGVPCNDRYHRGDSDGFPIGEALSRSLVGAVKTITNDVNQDKTWRTLKNGKIEEKNGKKKESYDVLIAFPNFGSAEGVSIVAPFGKQYVTDDEEMSPAELEERLKARRKSAFRSAAEPVCLAFEEKLKRLPDARLTVLLVRQISPGQIQLAYGNRILIRHFLVAVQRWQSTEGNVPESLKLPVPFKRVEGFRPLTPGLLFPEEVSSLLTHQWVRDGRESVRLNAPSVGLILDVFLNRLDRGSSQAAVTELLALLLQRSQALILHGGAQLHQDPFGKTGAWQKFAAPAGNANDPRWALLRTIGLMGTFLSLLELPVTTYMQHPAYLTGYLLACADELHIQYHNANSQGKLPSSLMGNGLLGRAAESPAAALAELMERSRIYLGWAKTAKSGKVSDELKADESREGREEKKLLYGASNAKRAMEQMQDLAPQLLEFYSEPAASGELDTVQKAQLFLGYLTPLPRRAKAPEESKKENNPE